MDNPQMDNPQMENPQMDHPQLEITTPEHATPARRPLSWFAGLCTGLMVFVAACGQDRPGQGGTPSTPTVSVASPIAREIVEYDHYTGRFQAVESVDIRARVSGYLDQITFTAGEIVEKDQVLFVIDQRPFQAALDAAEADVAAAEAQLKLAENDLRRAEPLLKRGNLSESDFDARVQQKNVAAATLQRSQANLRQAQLNLEFTEIRAPIRGRISREQVTKGNLITAGDVGGTALTSIVSLDPIYFIFTVSEQDYLKYVRLDRSGSRPNARENPTPVAVRLADEDDFTREGYIDFVDNRLSNSTGTISARAVFGNEDLLLTPGLFGRIRLPGSGLYRAILIPDEAVGSDQADKFVLVVTEDGKAERRPVVIGNLYNGLRIIKSGLTDEDRVIVAGLQRVRPGLPVKAEETSIEFKETALRLIPTTNGPTTNGPTTNGPTTNGPTMNGPTMKRVTAPAGNAGTATGAGE